MTEHITGAVESMARNRKAIKVDGEWYSAYSPKQLDGVEWKDEVEFDYNSVSKGGATFLNIEGDVRVVGQGSDERPAPRPTSRPAPSSTKSPAPASKYDTQRSIVRQNSATQANAVVAAAAAMGALPEGLDHGDVADLVLALAKRFEAYAMLED